MREIRTLRAIGRGLETGPWQAGLRRRPERGGYRHRKPTGTAPALDPTTGAGATALAAPDAASEQARADAFLLQPPRAQTLTGADHSRQREQPRFALGVLDSSFASLALGVDGRDLEGDATSLLVVGAPAHDRGVGPRPRCRTGWSSCVNPARTRWMSFGIARDHADAGDRQHGVKIR